MSASDRFTLSELVDHSAAPKILDIHLDDCESDACTGCDPQHLAEQAAARVNGWLPYGGHQSFCGYVGGITRRCTCRGAR